MYPWKKRQRQTLRGKETKGGGRGGGKGVLSSSKEAGQYSGGSSNFAYSSGLISRLCQQ